MYKMTLPLPLGGCSGHFDDSSNLGKERIVLSSAHIVTGSEFLASLAKDDGTRLCKGGGPHFDSQSTTG